MTPSPTWQAHGVQPQQSGPSPGLREPPIAPPAQEWQQLLAGNDLWLTSLCPGWWLSFSIPCVTNPYPTFTIFGYRPFLYFWVDCDRDLPQSLIPELVLKGGEEIC